MKRHNDFKNSIAQNSKSYKINNTTMNKSTASSKIIIVLIVALMLPQSIDAFRSSVTAKPPIVTPLDIPKEGLGRAAPRTQSVEAKEPLSSNQNTIPVPKPTTKPKKYTYDLGLGKNKPVHNKKIDDENKASAVEKSDPAQFLIDHESVRPYPSPMDTSSDSQRKSNKRKNLPKVQPKRHSEDVLQIRDPVGTVSTEDRSNGERIRHPVIVSINRSTVGRHEPSAKLDVNTVWVEMMLHNEHKKQLSK
mmetsp:Transcript_28140/g.60331  ORF Transcript_28140/g.60331 Transcript_28140/m.60331 type:complete len:248 (+) Transcript_28140:566-1309(+)